jgi:hypothetical protein
MPAAAAHAFHELIALLRRHLLEPITHTAPPVHTTPHPAMEPNQQEAVSTSSANAFPSVSAGSPNVAGITQFQGHMTTVLPTVTATAANTANFSPRAIQYFLMSVLLVETSGESPEGDAGGGVMRNA